MAKNKYKPNGSNRRKNSAMTTAPNGQGFASNRSSDRPSQGEASSAIPPANTETRTEADADAGRLDQIRDILFGQHLQTHDQRFEKLEHRLSEDYDHLRSHFIERLEALEQRLTDRMDRLSDRIDERLQATETVRDRQNAHLDEKITEASQALHHEIKHQTLTLKDTLEQQIEDVLSQIQKEQSARKHSTQTERSRLSNLLGELSKQLSQDATNDASANSKSAENESTDNAFVATEAS